VSTGVENKCRRGVREVPRRQRFQGYPDRFALTNWPSGHAQQCAIFLSLLLL
jgi:hypothetical protein